MNDNKKSKIWVYAVILFTSAFVVLLLTAYSQIKLNRNLSDYRNQINSKETEKNKYRQNFSSAQEMNVKLNEQIKKLQDEYSTLKSDMDGLKIQKEYTEKLLKEKSDAVEKLSNALTSYLNGKVIESAGLLKFVDPTKLDPKAAETYHTLSIKANTEAGKILFDQGFSLYNRARYSEAAEKLLLSSIYAPAATYSDKCLFYLAYSELKIDNKALAVEHMNKLAGNYPESRYLKSAKRFIEKYKP